MVARIKLALQEIWERYKSTGNPYTILQHSPTHDETPLPVFPTNFSRSFTTNPTQSFIMRSFPAILASVLAAVTIVQAAVSVLPTLHSSTIYADTVVGTARQQTSGFGHAQRG